MLAGQDLLSVTDFTRQILSEVALDQITGKTFEHLKTAALMHNLPLSDTVAIHEARLQTSSFSSDVAAWVDYHGFLKANSMHLEAKRVFERAMAACTDKQSILKQCNKKI